MTTTKKIKILTQYNRVAKTKKKGKWPGEYHTVPDMAYSVAELLKRVLTGQALPNEYTKKTGNYLDDVDHDTPDFEEESRKDFGERLTELREKQEEIKSTIDKENSERNNSLEENKLTKQWQDLAENLGAALGADSGKAEVKEAGKGKAGKATE